jgi:tRNA/rRNA methyltransferase
MNHNPTIILVRPQMGENIGSAARIMGNFGLNDLRIIAPRDGWPNERANALAAKAESIILNAKLYDNLSDALRDCHHAFAVTARLRSENIEIYAPKDAAAHACSIMGRTAFVFGAENNGLSNEEVMQCNSLLNIPTGEYSSLNLSHSIGIVAYEYFLHKNQPKTPQNQIENANIGSVNALIERLSCKTELPNSIKQQLLQMLLRSNLTESEVSLLHGLIN